VVDRGNACPNYCLFRRTRHVFVSAICLFLCLRQQGLESLRPCPATNTFEIYTAEGSERFLPTSVTCGRCSRLQGTKNASDSLFTVWICGNVVVGWPQLIGNSLVNMTVKCVDFTKDGEFFYEDIYCQLLKEVSAV